MNPSGKNKKPSDFEFEEMCDLFPDEDPSLLRTVLDNSEGIQDAIKNIFKLKVPPSEENKHQEELKSFKNEIEDYDICDVDKILVSLKHSQLPTTLPQQYPRQINNVMDSFSVSTSTSRPASKAPSIKSPIGTTKFKITSQISATNNNKCGSVYSSDSASFFSVAGDDKWKKPIQKVPSKDAKSLAPVFKFLAKKKAEENVTLKKKTEETETMIKTNDNKIAIKYPMAKLAIKSNQLAHSNLGVKAATQPEISDHQQLNFNKNNDVKFAFKKTMLCIDNPSKNNNDIKVDQSTRRFPQEFELSANGRFPIAISKSSKARTVHTNKVDNEGHRSAESIAVQSNNKEPTNNQNDHTEQFDSMKNTQKQIYRDLIQKSRALEINPTDTITQILNTQESTFSFKKSYPSVIVKDRNLPHVEASTSAVVYQHEHCPSKGYANAAQIEKTPASHNNSVAAQKAPEVELPLGIVIENEENNKPMKNPFKKFNTKLKEKNIKYENNDSLEGNIKSDFFPNKAKADRSGDFNQYILKRFFLIEPEVEPKEPESRISVEKAVINDFGDLKKEVVPTMNGPSKIDRLNVEKAVTCTLYSIGHYHLTVKADVIKNLPVGEYFAIPMAEYLEKGYNKINYGIESRTHGVELISANYNNLNKACKKDNTAERPCTKWDEDIAKELGQEQFQRPNKKTITHLATANTLENNIENELYYDILFNNSSISSEEDNNDIRIMDEFPVDLADPAESFSPTKCNENLKISDKKVTDVIKQQLRLMKVIFPDMDENLIQTKVNACQGDSGKFEDLIDWEERKLNEVKRNEETLRNELSHLLQKLPHLDPDYVEAKWFEIAGDEEKQNDFITTELLMKKEADLKELLRTRLPHLSKAQLEELSALFSNDELNLELFIAKETERQEVNNLIATAEEEGVDMDENEILNIWNTTNGDAGAVLEFIEKKKQNMNMIMTALSILPDAEPAFLTDVWKVAGEDPMQFNALIEGYVERNDYPKIQNEDPQVRSRISLWNKYVENFDVIHYLQCVKDPVEKFITNAGKTAADFKYVEKFLKERYNGAELDFENLYVNQFNSQLAKFCVEYDNIYRPTCTAVSLLEDDLPEKFLQESVNHLINSFLSLIAFILYKTEITDHLAALKIKREKLITRARVVNILLECQCCFDDLLPDEGIPCPDDHLFCQNCVIRACEVKLGENDPKIKCLTNCDKFFTLPVLREVLAPGLMRQLERKQQSEEIAEAGVTGLESCQYCEFSYIPPEDDKVFVCRNPECLKETCRLCKEPSHIPLRCKEVERPKDTQVRTQIEETMSEALFRTCYRCKRKFVKVDGCNKMTCDCGAIMCYICRQPVENYEHFNGEGGTNYDRCPLFSDDNELHGRVVTDAGVRARDAALQANPDVNLVHDPTLIKS